VKEESPVATYPAIAATGLAIQTLLTNASAGTEFASASFPLFQSTDFSAGIPEGRGVSIFLYRVTPNATRRNDPPRVTPGGYRTLPLLPLDLFYLLTVWGGNAVAQQRLLGWAMRTLQDTPILTAGMLNEGSPERDIFRHEETVELVLDPLSLQDMNVIWDLFKLGQPQVLQLSITYVARVVVLDSTVFVTDAGPVQTRELDYVKVPATQGM
jgi:Pvc16 N-terminal domain